MYSSSYEGVSCRRSPRRAYESSFFHAGCEYLRVQAGSWISKNFFFSDKKHFYELTPISIMFIQNEHVGDRSRMEDWRSMFNYDSRLPHDK